MCQIHSTANSDLFISAAQYKIGVPFQEDRLPLNPLGHERVPWQEKGCPPSEWIKQEYSRYFAGGTTATLFVQFRDMKTGEDSLFCQLHYH